MRIDSAGTLLLQCIMSHIQANARNSNTKQKPHVSKTGKHLLSLSSENKQANKKLKTFEIHCVIQREFVILKGIGYTNAYYKSILVLEIYWFSQPRLGYHFIFSMNWKPSAIPGADYRERCAITLPIHDKIGCSAMIPEQQPQHSEGRLSLLLAATCLCAEEHGGRYHLVKLQYSWCKWDHFINHGLVREVWDKEGKSL